MYPAKRRRIIALLVVALLLLWPLYIGAMWIAFRNDILTNAINGAQTDADFTAKNAWSPWPGAVRADEILINVHDSSVEMSFVLKDVEAQFRLTRLFKKEVSVSDVNVRDLRFRYRSTRSLTELCTTQGRAFAPMPNLTLPPDDKAGWKERCEAQKETAKKSTGDSDPNDLWRVHIQDINAASVPELWLQEYRFTGTSSVKGGFYLWPAKTFHLEPSSVALNGVVDLADQRLLENLHARVAAAVEPSNPDEMASRVFLEHMTATASVSAQLMSVDPLNRYFSEGLSIRGGRGEIEINGMLRDGRTSLSTIRIASNAIRFSSPKVKVEVDAAIPDRSVTIDFSKMHAAISAIGIRVRKFEVKDMPFLAKWVLEALVSGEKAGDFNLKFDEDRLLVDRLTLGDDSVDIKASVLKKDKELKAAVLFGASSIIPVLVKYENDEFTPVLAGAPEDYKNLSQDYLNQLVSGASEPIQTVREQR